MFSSHDGSGGNVRHPHARSHEGRLPNAAGIELGKSVAGRTRATVQAPRNAHFEGPGIGASALPWTARHYWYYRIRTYSSCPAASSWLTAAMSSTRAGEPGVGDAFGFALLDYLEHGLEAHSHFIERDDGLLETIDTRVLFTEESDWSVVEAPVGDRAGQRVLDVGAGAGRHTLPLQESGREVVALDVSSGAVEVCRRRGLRETFTGTVFELAETDPEPFDTFLLCGNNYGLLESPEHGLSFLGALAEVAAPGAEIIGTCIDPFATEDPLHLGYHERNRSRGRHPGQIRLRARWRDLATSWFDYLFVPVEELKELGERAGWALVEYQPGSRPYLAVLRLHEESVAT